MVKMRIPKDREVNVKANSMFRAKVVNEVDYERVAVDVQRDFDAVVLVGKQQAGQDIC